MALLRVTSTAYPLHNLPAFCTPRRMVSLLQPGRCLAQNARRRHMDTHGVFSSWAQRVAIRTSSTPYSTCVGSEITGRPFKLPTKIKIQNTYPRPANPQKLPGDPLAFPPSLNVYRIPLLQRTYQRHVLHPRDLTRAVARQRGLLDAMPFHPRTRILAQKGTGRRQAVVLGMRTSPRVSFRK